MATDSPKTHCGLCGRSMTFRGMGRHLSSCLEKNIQQIAEKDRKEPGILHVKVHGGGKGSPYWLHLALDQDTPLNRLDSFLRDIWLECCGHGSAFFENIPYTSAEIDMDRKLGKALGPGELISHIYDFSLSSHWLFDW